MSNVYESPDQKAKRLGLRVVRPSDRQVFLDIDSLDAWIEAKEQFALLTETREAEWVERPSRTPDHYHVTITFLDGPALTPSERVAWQAILGSDRKREILAMRQIVDGREADASVFFEPEIV